MERLELLLTLLTCFNIVGVAGHYAIAVLTVGLLVGAQLGAGSTGGTRMAHLGV